MPIHQLISSGSLACLETALLERIGEQKRDDPLQPVVVVCASAFLGRYLARRLVRGGMPHLGIHFLTLNDLARALAQPLLLSPSEPKSGFHPNAPKPGASGTPGLPGTPLENGWAPLPGGGKELLVRRFLRELPETSYFFQAETDPHLSAVLAATLTDLEDSRVDVASAAPRAAESIPGARRKLTELAQHYQRYRSALSARRMFSEAGLLAEAGRGAARFGALFGTTALLVYGFYEHTGAQLELLRRLAAHADVTAFLLAEPGARLGASHVLREWWKARPARERRLDWPAPENDLTELQARWFAGESGPPPQHAQRRHVLGTPAQGPTGRKPPRPGSGLAVTKVPFQASLFPAAEHVQPAGTGPTEARPDDGTVRVILCPDEVAEVREIAREAIRLQRDEGIAHTEMAVLAHDPAYLPLLAGVFERAGVPYYIREGLPLEAVPAGRSLLAALALPARGYGRTEVMQWLTLGALASRTLTPAGAEAPLTLWDRLSAEAGVVSGEKQWRERLEAMLAGLISDLQNASSERRSLLEYRRTQTTNLLAFMERLFATGSGWLGCRTWTALADSAAVFLRRFHPPSRECEQVQEQLASLGDLDRLGEPVDLLEFRAAVERALNSSTRKVGTLERTGVHLLSLTAARHTRFRVVFVPGLVEGGFPLPGRQDPILLDEERRALSGQEAALPLKGARPQEERLLFLLALEAARERLILTVPRADAVTGSTKIPSYYVLAALECLAGRPFSYSDLTGGAVPRLRVVRRSYWLTQTGPTALDLREFDLGKVKAILESEQPEASRYLEHGSPSFARALEAEQAQWANPRFTPYDGMLASPVCRQALGELFSPERVYAATALERYASCPYRFFLHDVLQLRELDDPVSSDAIGPQDKGELMHAILSDFYGALKARQRLPLTGQKFETCREILAETCARHFETAERKGITGLPATWELNRRFIQQDLERYLRTEIEDDGNWLPVDFERSFGIEDEATALEVPAGAGMLKLRGIIDRIDLGNNGAAVRVIDYKAGKKRHPLSVDLAGGRALQLPLYLRAAQALHPRAELESSVAEYCYLTRAGEWSRCIFSGTDLVEKQARLSEILGTILAGCRDGVFPHCPEGNGTGGCGGCEYRAVGDPRREALWKRKQSDPRLEPFRRMREME